MKVQVQEFIKMLEKLPKDAVVKINGSSDFMVWNSPTSQEIDIVSEEEEEIIEEEYDDFFNSLAKQFDEMMEGEGEVLDSLKINGVR